MAFMRPLPVHPNAPKRVATPTASHATTVAAKDASVAENAFAPWSN